MTNFDRQGWVDWLSHYHIKSIEHSVKESTIYKGKLVVYHDRGNPFIIESEHTLTEAIHAYKWGRTCILSRAYHNEPLEGFLKGSTSQEALLCSESNLFPILHEIKNSAYTRNTKGAIYIPDVMFFESPKHVTFCDVISFRSLEVDERGIDLMVHIALDHEVKTLIINPSEFGCDSFSFMKAVSGTDLKCVVFTTAK